MYLHQFLRLLLTTTLLWSLSALTAEARIDSSTFENFDSRRSLQGRTGLPPRGTEGEFDTETATEGDSPSGPPPKNSKWDVTEKIPRYAASLSIFGSLWIIIEILRDEKKRRLCYHRLIFAISLFDLASSVSYLVSSFLERPPRGSQIRTRDCEVPGFFLYWASLAIPMYNTALATYFYLSVVSGWREEKIWKQFERYVQVLIPMICLIVAIVPWPLEMYNPFHQYCFIFGGRGNPLAFVYTFAATVLLASLFVTVIMLAVYCRVKKTFEKSDRFRFGTQGKSTFSSDTLSSDTLSSDALKRNKAQRKAQRKEAKKHRKNTMVNRVRTMTYLYTIPFYATWTIPVIWAFIEQNAVENGTPQVSRLTTYVMHVWLALFLPLQGFLNWLVYMFPRFQRIRGEDRSKSICLVVAGVLGGIFKSRRRQASTKPTAGKSSEMAGASSTGNDDDNESMIGDMMSSEGSSTHESLKPVEEPVEDSIDQMESGLQSKPSTISQSSEKGWLDNVEENEGKSSEERTPSEKVHS